MDLVILGGFVGSGLAFMLYILVNLFLESNEKSFQTRYSWSLRRSDATVRKPQHGEAIPPRRLKQTVIRSEKS